MVELPIEQPGDWDPAARGGILRGRTACAAGVCVVMAPGRELCATDAATVASTQAYLKDVRRHRGGRRRRRVGGPVYASVGRTWRMTADERAACYAELREKLAPVAEHGAERGVKVASSRSNRYETSVINTVEQALEVIDGLPRRGCGLLHRHLPHEHRGEGLRRGVTLAGDRLAHVQRRPTTAARPGADHLDWPAFRDALAAAGYDGPIVIESFTAENETIATAASIWRPLAASQDDIAVDGLAFLRDLLG